MRFKEDWAECKERFDAFWQGRMLDRCLVSAIALRQDPMPSAWTFQHSDRLEDRWMNTELLYNNMMAGCHQAYLGGEAFPNFFPNLGPGVVAGFIGAPFQLAEHTVWFDHNPIIQDWENVPAIRLDRSTRIWQTICHMTSSWVSRSQGDYLVALPDLGGTLDIAASLRGTEPLLMDLVDNPEAVLDLAAQIDRVWIESYNALHALTSLYQEGTTTWLPLWCRGRYYTLQCDFSAMISPDQFRRFVLPSLQRQARFLDHSIYHLDGPGQLAHLDILLNMQELSGIQWVPGAGSPDEMDACWYPIYRKIQGRGKRLILSCQDTTKIEPLLRAVDPAGLFISTQCTREDEARDLIRNALQWSRTAKQDTGTEQ